jgi:hypothetical protein
VSKHQVFLVHGMGEFEAGWSETPRAILAQAVNAYPRLRDNGFASAFEYKEISYNHVFDAWREQWRQDAAKAAKALTAVGLGSGVADELIKAAGQPAGGGFWRTHVLDVIGYRFLMPVAQEVWRSVQAQILGHLKSFPDDDRPSYSVVAHSLGTAVVYEAFHAMLTNGADGHSAPLGSALRPDNVFMLANVAKPLWNRGGSVYPPLMSPSLANGDGLCFRFANFWHQLDPIARMDRFDPPAAWFPPLSPRDEVYLDVALPVQDLQDANVHAFEHYLGHPLVHVPMLRWLAGFKGAVSKKELDDALVKWRADSLAAKELQRARAKLEGLLVNATADWSSEIAMLLTMRELAAASVLKDGES